MPLSEILADHPSWYKEFNEMKVTGLCDALCDLPATTWFGRTNRATCGSQKCIDILQEEYDNT